MLDLRSSLNTGLMALTLMLRRAFLGSFVFVVFALSPAVSHGQSAQGTVSIALSSDGRFLAALVLPVSEAHYFVIRDGALRLYDMLDLLAPPKLLSAFYDADTELAFSPNGEYLAALDERGLFVFRTSDGSNAIELKRKRNGWTDSIQTISFSPDSAYMRGITTYDKDGMLLPIWRIETRELVTIARADTPDFFTKVRLSPDWTQILAYDQVFDFDFETGTGGLIGTLEFGAYPGYGDDRGELFHERRPLFATATHDCIVQLYDTRSWTVSKSWDHPDSECEYGIGSVDFSRAKPWLAFTDHPKYWQWCESLKEARLVVWNYQEDVLVFEAATHASNSRFTPDDRFIVASGCRAGDGDAQISVWDTESDFAFRAYPGSSPQLHPNSELMVTIGHDGKIWIWNLALGTPVAVLPAIPS